MPYGIEILFSHFILVSTETKYDGTSRHSKRTTISHMIKETYDTLYMTQLMGWEFNNEIENYLRKEAMTKFLYQIKFHTILQNYKSSRYKYETLP